MQPGGVGEGADLLEQGQCLVPAVQRDRRPGEGDEDARTSRCSRRGVGATRRREGIRTTQRGLGVTEAADPVEVAGVQDQLLDRRVDDLDGAP
ncbi:hypothetical protein [Pedococcus aerophilus]|uniref:hypothetical protein n=1 Tax=Pedococcus aerophilus TaxID=436356 RepID=UPI0031DF18A8